MQATVSESDRKRFSAEEVLIMIEHGLLDDERLELVDGELIHMSPKGTRHVGMTSRLVKRLSALLDDGHWVVQEGTLRCGPRELREPDVMVVPGALEDWLERFPTGADTFLVVEVAQTSQRYDRAKADIYASAGVPEFWLLDLEARRLERRRHPTPDGQYALVELLDEAAWIDVLDTGARWQIRELLP